MNPPSFRATVTALAAGQLVCWAALYYTFSSFVLPMQRENETMTLIKRF